VSETFQISLPSNGGCTDAGFDLDGTMLAVRVTPSGVELLEGTKSGFLPTLWKEARLIDADLDGDGWFDTACTLAAYGGDVWVAWVERDPTTHVHGNMELRKIVDHAVTSIKSVMQQQV
jgi:hypothetical protein